MFTIIFFLTANDNITSEKSPGHLLSRSGRNVQVFSLKELKSATRNFHMMNCIGRGGFGPVYKVKHCIWLHVFCCCLPMYVACYHLLLLLQRVLFWKNYGWPNCKYGMSDNDSTSIRETWKMALKLQLKGFQLNQSKELTSSWRRSMSSQMSGTPTL